MSEWKKLTIGAGEEYSEIIPISSDSIDVSGFHGNQRPRFYVEDLGGAGCRIVLKGTSDEDVVFRYRDLDEGDA